jgi:hypothetical protein
VANFIETHARAGGQGAPSRWRAEVRA